MSTFAVYINHEGKSKCIGSGCANEAAINSACDTLASMGFKNEWTLGSLVEKFPRDINVTSPCWLHPLWNGAHVTGCS